MRFYWILHEHAKNVLNRSNWYLLWVCLPTGTTPSVFIEPKHKTVREGKGLSLSCVTTGKPKPRIRWKKNGKTIMPDNRIRTRVTETGSKLRIRNATIQDSGMYHCVAKLRNHHSTSEKAIIHVIGGAVFYGILSHSLSRICHKIRHTILQIPASLLCR